MTESPRSPLPLSVLTFNLYGGDDFRTERLPHIVSEIGARTPDVLCLQECTETIADAIIALRPARVAGSSSARNAGGTDGGALRYAVAWRKRDALLSHTGLATVEEVAAKFGWDLPGEEEHEGHQTLYVMVSTLTTLTPW